MSKNKNEEIGIWQETAKATIHVLKKLITSSEKEQSKNKIVRWKDLEQVHTAMRYSHNFCVSNFVQINSNNNISKQHNYFIQYYTPIW